MNEYQVWLMDVSCGDDRSVTVEAEDEFEARELALEEMEWYSGVWEVMRVREL